jgi:hypothetical protein
VARVVDGYIRLWLRVPARETVVVLDYQGAPYVRFDPRGVWVNARSQMAYLNLTPPEDPPAGTTRRTPPRWQHVGSGHAFEWHDGRLQDLSGAALAPAQRFVGIWQIPLRIGDRPTAIVGRLWRANGPPLIWFWPILVLLTCVLAAWRLRRPELDDRLVRALALSLLAALTVAAFSRNLHGRPAVTSLQWAELAASLALIVTAALRVARSRAGYLLYGAIAFAAIWEGVTLLPTLRDGYVLVALPAFLVRSATVTCLGAGAAVAAVSVRLAGRGGGERVDRGRPLVPRGKLRGRLWRSPDGSRQVGT